MSLPVMDSTPPWTTPPPPGQHHLSPSDSTTPSRSTRGRYASYWNVFLLLKYTLQQWSVTLDNIYRLQRSCGKVMFSQASVILAHTPLCRPPPPEQTPTPHPCRRLLQRTVRILLECILVTCKIDIVIILRNNILYLSDLTDVTVYK